MYREDEWRHYVIIQLIGIRRAVYELSFSVGLMVLGFMLVDWNKNAPLVAAGAVCVGAAISYFNERQSQRTLERSFARWQERQDY